MPFLSLNQKDLQKALGLCNQVSPKRSDIEVFSYTKLTVSQETVVLSAINSNVFYQVKLNLETQSKVDQDLSVLVKTDIFTSSVSLISDDLVGLDINTDNLSMVVQGASSKHTLRINQDKLEDFIEPKENPDELEATLVLGTQELLAADKLAFTTVGLPQNIYQPEFLSVCYTLNPQENCVYVVSCDKFRISKTKVEATFQHLSDNLGQEPVNFLIQPKGLQLLAVAATEEKDIELNFERTTLWVRLDKATLTLRYGEGKFPDYDKIIPQSFTCSFALGVKEAQEGLRQAYLCAKANLINKSVNLQVDPKNKKLTFLSKTDDGYASESVVDMENYEGVQDVWNQSFNADYLLDFINSLQSEKVLFEANPGKPLVMSPENQKTRQLCLVQGLR